MSKVPGIIRCLVSFLVMVAGCQGPSDVVTSPHSFSSPATPSPYPRALEQPYRVAILPFENISRHSHLNWLRRGLQEMLVSDLAQWPQLEVISRDALGPVLREQWLQQRGFSSSATSVGLGRLKGVRYLIQGRMYAQEETLAVDLQIVDVETGVVVGSVNTQGRESDIPGLEQELVTQIIRVFDPSPSQTMGDHIEENRPTDPRRRPEAGEENGNLSSSGRVPSYPVHQIDALLSLEKLTHLRREAYRLAETIWQEGWEWEMGKPLYHIWHFPNDPTWSVPIMSIPISLFFSPHRISAIFEQAQKTGTDVGGYVDSDGFQTALDEGSGAQPLFMEHFQQPRRVFIRARNEQGEVLAFYSHWAWRTEDNILRRDSRGVSLAMWPKTFVSGFMQFPVDWVEREGQDATFDVMVVPVPDEHVVVRLEPIGESKEESGDLSRPIDQEDILLQSLERLLQLHWAPAITEGLPVQGYLPGNKRTAVGVIQVQNGKIRHIRFQHWPEDPFFLKSLEDLQAKVSGICVECQDSGHVLLPLPELDKTFRVQFTLVKDMDALHLGSRFH